MTKQELKHYLGVENLSNDILKDVNYIIKNYPNCNFIFTNDFNIYVKNGFIATYKDFTIYK